ncbi:hypothetical protein CsSME_00030528 [Camellia sinensis var. sinensis]
MSVHVIPVSVAKRIEQLQRDFLWGTGGEGSHYHLVAWDRICRPKVQGGLGIRRLVLFNVALLRKWLRVVVAKFGEGHGGWCSGRVGHSHGYGLWKGIWLGWEEFWKRVKLKVGLGDRVRFWRDRWCGDLTLEEWFPLVFGIAVDAEVLVGAVWSGHGVSTFWNVALRRAVQDWEQGQLMELLAFLYELRVGEVGQDSLVWECPGAKGTFSVSSYYRVLAHVEEVVFPWKCVWVLGTPSKVAFFVWTAMLGRVLTLDNLIRCGHILVNWCCLCCGAVESMDHLFIHCPVSSPLWMLVVATFDLAWVQPASVQAVLHSWAGGRVGRRRRKAWMLASHCILWLVWLERNRRVFQGLSHSVLWLERRLLTILYGWVTRSVDPDVLAFVEFVEDLIC